MVSVTGQTRYLVGSACQFAIIFLLIECYYVMLLLLQPVFLGLQHDIFEATTDCGSGKPGVSSCSALGSMYQTSVQGVAGFLMMILAPLYGVFSDRVGRKYLLVLSLTAAMWSCFFLLGPPATLTPYYIVTVLCGLLPDMNMMMFTVLSDIVPSGQRVWYFVNFASAMLVIGAVGAAVASVILLYMEPQKVLQMTIGVSFSVFFLLALVMPETLPKKSAQTGHLGLASPKEDEKSSPPPRSPPRSKSVARVLLSADDEEARWQRGFYWLFVLSSVPDLGLNGILPFYCQGAFHFTPPELSMVTTCAMGSAILWGSILLIPLKMICSNDARVFQVCVVVNSLHLLPFLFMSQHWTPYLVTFFTGAGLLQPNILRGMISELTDAEHQGRVNGILGACQNVCKALAPPFCSWLYTNGSAIGIPSLPFIFFGVVVLPVSLVISSFTLLPQCLPQSVQKRLREREEQRAQAAKEKERRSRNQGPGQWNEWRLDLTVPLYLPDSKVKLANGTKPINEVVQLTTRAMRAKQQLPKLTKAITGLISSPGAAGRISEQSFRNLLKDTAMPVLSKDELEEIFPVAVEPEPEVKVKRRSRKSPRRPIKVAEAGDKTIDVEAGDNAGDLDSSFRTVLRDLESQLGADGSSLRDVDAGLLEKLSDLLAKRSQQEEKESEATLEDEADSGKGPYTTQDVAAEKAMAAQKAFAATAAAQKRAALKAAEEMAAIQQAEEAQKIYSAQVALAQKAATEKTAAEKLAAEKAEEVEIARQKADLAKKIAEEKAAIARSARDKAAQAQKGATEKASAAQKAAAEQAAAHKETYKWVKFDMLDNLKMGSASGSDSGSTTATESLTL